MRKRRLAPAVLILLLALALAAVTATGAKYVVARAVFFFSFAAMS